MIMELDELKRQLNQQLASSQQSKDAGALGAILKQASSSVVAKITRNLKMELGFAVLFTLGCLAGTFLAPLWSFKTYMAIASSIGLGFVLVLVYLLIKINTYQSSPLPLKDNLLSILKIVEKYVKTYYQLSMMLIPVCLFLALLLSFKDPARSAEIFSTTSILLLAVYMLVLSVVVYYFNKWYINKLYGKYTNKLKESLAELD